jgi:D-alanyl-D-alanine carboxypeptidase/D-alanyl-D-alanine-endopeptidase (penicillin-binding protein 4)
LAAEGITVGQAFVVSSTPVGDERELAAVESPTLATLLLETNQESNNLYAEVLLRSLGTKVGGAGIRTVSTDSTAKKGLNLVKATLTELGIDPESYVLVDGSGYLVKTWSVQKRSHKPSNLWHKHLKRQLTGHLCLLLVLQVR